MFRESSELFNKRQLFIIFNFYVKKNTIFSMMNINFFNDTGNVIVQCIFSGEDHLFLFWQKSNIIYVRKRNIIFTKFTENIIFTMYFLKKIMFNFPSKE